MTPSLCSMPNFVMDKYDNPNISGCCKFIGEVGDNEFIKSCLKDSQPDLIYYLISNFNVRDLNDYADTVKHSLVNINNLINCLQSDVRLIYTGSSAQYGMVPVSDQPVQESYNF